MTIIAGNDIVASDFISTSAGAGDSGKVPKLNAVGQIDRTFLKSSFGGTGADGALSISAGTTNYDLAGAQVFIKNFTSISITGTGNITFTNPHANGTTIIFKSQGNVTLTSSASPIIEASNLGASGGAEVTGNASSNSTMYQSGGASVANNTTLTTGSGNDQRSGNPAYGVLGIIQGGTSWTSINGANYTKGYEIATGTNTQLGKMVPLCPGSGGSSGLGRFFPYTGGRGGRGGGAFMIECGGAYSASGNTIYAKGEAGQAHTSPNNDQVGCGGGGGCVAVLYNTLTSDTGVYTVTGGASATGAGGDGYSYVGLNVNLV